MFPTLYTLNVSFLNVWGKQINLQCREFLFLLILAFLAIINQCNDDVMCVSVCVNALLVNQIYPQEWKLG